MEYLNPFYRKVSLISYKNVDTNYYLHIEGGLVQDGSFVSMVHHHIKRLCTKLLPDAVALVDAFALPDFLLRSALGNADGEVRWMDCKLIGSIRNLHNFFIIYSL